MRNRSSVQIIGAVLVLLLVAIVIGRPASDGPPLDPESVGELGTRALVEFLEAGGAIVELGVPDDNADVALVLRDQLDGQGREDLLNWIQAGGQAVITDQASPLVDTGIRNLVDGDDLERGQCGVEGLGDVVTLGGSSLALLDPVPGSATCFGDEGGAYILRFPEGAGTVTALGGAIPLTNRNLDEGDNAVLAGRLLLGAGSLDNAGDQTRINVIYTPFGVASGQRTPFDLIGSNVRWFGIQLLVVSALGLLWAIRRFGPIVSEPAIVELPGSLAVRATGELHRRSKSGPASASVIQQSIAARVRHEYRILPEHDITLATQRIADRSGVPFEDVLLLLQGAPIADTAAALQQSRRIAAIGQRVLHPALAPTPETEDESSSRYSLSARFRPSSRPREEQNV